MASKEEEEIELLVIGLVPDIKQELIECYFDSQDLVVISVTLPEQDKAVVKLTGLKDIESFCAKTHKIKNSVVTIEPICKRTETLDDINADTIEVMCDPNLDTSMVECYFQGPKSGGGRDKVVEMIRTVELGKYHVKFESKEDVDVILAKESHAVMKKPITVCRLLPPPVKPPEPEHDHKDDDKSPAPKQLYELNKLFIDNIPDDASEDLLTTLLDGRLDLDHEENDYTVTLKHPQALVNFTTQYSIEELKEFCKKLTGRKLKGQPITAELCKINCTILISNIGNKSFSSQDTLQLYFENKRSGGGEDMVESIVMLGSNRAKITFKNSTVVTSVLSKKHPKLGPDVMLVPATPLQDDTSDSSLDGDESITKDKKLGAESQTPDSKSTVSTPEIIRKPVVLPLDPVIAKYLHKKPDILDGLSKEIFMTISTDNETVILQPNDSSPPDYTESSVKQFQYLLSTVVSKVDIHIPSEAANNIYPMVMQKCTSENMEFAFNADQLSIAGESKSVTDLQTTVQELSKRLIQTTEEVKLELEDYQFVTNCKRKEIEKKHQGIKLVLNNEDCTLSVSGSIHDVSQFKETLPTFVCHFKVPVNLVGLPVEFLYKDKGAGILTTLIDNSPVFPFFSTIPHSRSLSLLCSQDAAQMAEQIALKISDVIIEKEFMFSPYFFSNVADSSQFSDFKQRMSKTYAYISILEDNRFKLACRKEILPKLSQSFEKFVAEECSITDKVMFKKGVWRLLNSVMEKRWCDVKEEMAKKEVSLVHSSKESAPKPFVKIKGEREMVADMKAKIIQLQSSVKEERVTLSRPGLLQYFFKDPNGKFVLTGLESEAKVCIELEITKDEKDFNDSNTHVGPNFKRVCFANMKGGATINVSIGDITQFNKAEVIVNAANEDLAHGAGVAGAISDCGGQIITKDSDDYTRKYGKVHTGSAVIFHRVGNLPPPYKAIVHAVGPRWNSFGDNKKEIALLRKTVKISLKVSRNYSSIAIPAISSGVYGFPPDVSANTLVKAVVEYFDSDPSANMNDIHFVILKDNVDVFIKAIKANFETVHTFNDNPPPVTSTPIKPQPTSDVPTKSLQTGRRASTKPKTSLTTSVDTSNPVTPKPVTPKLSFMKITNGDILNHQCEVLVNTTDQQLQYFFKDPNGKFVLTGLENKAKVCIELEITKDEKDFNDSNTHVGPNFKRVCFANMKGGATINVSIGDITQFNKAEVIVNAANEDLAHGAGVAGAISDCGGQIITKDLDDYTRKYGKVHTGSAVIFHRVGNLPPPYKAIVHAVGPRWNSFGDNKKEIALLRKTVKISLKVSRNFSSIAIPAISSGVYGFPPDVSANTLVKAVVEYFDSDPSANMNDIHFVILKDNVDVFIKAIKANFETVHTFNDNPPPVTSTPIKPQPTSDVPTKSLQTGRRASTKPKTSLTTSVDTSNPVTPKPVTPKLSFMKITNGDILNHQCEVLVNTTDQQLSFGGFVGRILLKAAGQGLEDECKSIIAKQPDIQHGDIVTTRAHQLNSKHIVHVVLPGYSGVQSETTLRSVIKKCLQECTRLKAKSISIPSVGAGNLGYPGDTVALCLLEETLNYLTINEGKTSLQLIHFVIFDANIHQAFQTQLTQISNPSANPSTSPSISPSSIRSTKVGSSDSRVPRPIVKELSSKSTAGKNRPRSSQPDHNVVPSSNDDSCSFSLPNGGVLQLIQGDITIEQTDVIVNTTNPELRLGGSGVSGALLRKGGGSLQAACDTLRAQNIKAAEGKVVETRCKGMGQLQCKSIFHIVFDGKDQRKLLKTILACLDRAEKMKYTSIALPAIGTGNVAYPTALAAEGIVKALKQFIQRKPNHVKKIRMVIFMPQMFKQFTEAFKKIEENDPGILSLIYGKGTKFFQSVEDFFTPNFDDDSSDEGMEWSGLEDDDRREIPDKEDEDEEYTDLNDLITNSSLGSDVTMCIYGESEQAVKRADKRLKAVIDTQFINEEVDDSNIIELPQSAIENLTTFAEQQNVDIDIDIDPAIHTIKLHGCHNDVMKVKDKVRDLLAKVNEWKTKEEAAAAVYKHVQWVQQLSNDQKDAYSECLSYEIEQAFQQKKPVYCYDGDDEHFKIDFSKSEETDLDSGSVVKVQRVDFSEVEKPPKWASMPKDRNGRELTVHLVALKQSDPEYKDAQAKFDVTMRSRYTQIVTIQRIQNPVLYGQYIARKKEMEKRNPPGCQNERWLFHGTKPHVVENINTQGFNRSFKNVTAYGQGAYFARDALYSAGYAPPDANQHHHMYLTRVLTGEFTVGNSSLVVPPPKNNQLNQFVLYDSTVDSTTNPSIFVVYTDPQAYAAYLITYK